MPNGNYPNKTSLMSSNTNVVTSSSAAGITRDIYLRPPLDGPQQQLQMQGELQQQDQHQQSGPAFTNNFSHTFTQINVNMSFGQVPSHKSTPFVTSQYCGSIITTGENGKDSATSNKGMSIHTIQETQFATSMISQMSQKDQKFDLKVKTADQSKQSELLIQHMKMQQGMINFKTTLLETLQQHEGSVSANLPKTSNNIHCNSHLEKYDKDYISSNVVATGDLSDLAPLKDCQFRADDDDDDLESLSSLLLSSDEGCETSTPKCQKYAETKENSQNINNKCGG